MNVVDLRIYDKICEAANMLIQGKVDIAWIQETREANAADLRIGEYTIYRTPAQNPEGDEKDGQEEQTSSMGSGGVAIIIRTDLTSNIMDAGQCDERLKHLQLRDQVDYKNLLIINS